MAPEREDDRVAILRVIDAETRAFFAKDFEAWAACWVQEDHTRRLDWHPRGGALVNRGWAEESANMRIEMEQHPLPNPSMQSLRREDVQVRIDRDMAWVSFDQIAPRTGDALDVPGRQYELRVLERRDGEWRIACVVAIGSPLEFATSPLLRVDERAAVLWANEAAVRELGRLESLRVIGGRLFAGDRAGNKRLQAAIRRAAGRRSYGAREAGRSIVATEYGVLPVFLDDPGNPGAEMCWVIANGGMVLVAFDDEASRRARIEDAAAVYGLTPAQTRLAALIVEGHDLVEAARQLGVSVNTARTQLRRMFEKTGVNGQPALVRALLSVLSPLP